MTKIGCVLCLVILLQQPAESQVVFDPESFFAGRERVINSYPFSHHFEKVDEQNLRIDNTVWISGIDFDRSGNMLVTDRRNQRVFLFDENNIWVNTIRADTISSVEWQPFSARFMADGRIFVNNGLHSALIFGRMGTLLERVPVREFLFLQTLFTSNQKMYAIQANETENRVVQFGRRGEVLNTLINFPKSGKLHSTLMNLGRGLTEHSNGDIYVAHPLEPRISVFSAENNLLRTIELSPYFYNPRQTEAGFTHDYANSSIILSLFFLNDETLLVQYRHNWFHYYTELIDVSTGASHGKPLKADSPVLFAGNNQIFMLDNLHPTAAIEDMMKINIFELRENIEGEPELPSFP